MSFPGWLLAAFLAATLSYHGLEKPLMRLRARFRKAD
jgi:peptidoglycan/LPS O-acetylase OafA/YrhL